MRVAADLKELKLTRFHQRTVGYPLVMLLTTEHMILANTTIGFTLWGRCVPVLSRSVVLH